MSNKDISIFFGKRLKEFRDKQNLSQEELSFRSGLNPSYIGRLERGEKCPSISTVYQIAKGLKVPTSALIDIDYDIDKSEVISMVVDHRLKKACEDLNEDQVDSIVKVVEEIVKYMK